MPYSIKQIAEFAKIFHKVELEARDFLFLSASALKNKDYREKCAARTLAAIDEYRKLSNDVRVEIEKDKTNSVNRLKELEGACNKIVLK